MDINAFLRNKAIWAVPLALLLFGGKLPYAAASDMMSTICRNQVVSVGDRKGEVSMKCGPPLSRSQDAVSSQVTQTASKKQKGKMQADDHKSATKKSNDDNKKVAVKTKTVKERAETWTYVIDGSYRFFIFKDGKLASIEAGGIAN